MADASSVRYISVIFHDCARQPARVTMSSIHSDARLDRASLTTQVGLDDLRRGEQGLRTPEAQARDHAPAASSPAERTLDSGETVLNADAWGDVPAGDRMLLGDQGFESQLGALDLSLAADLAADVIADSFI